MVINLASNIKLLAYASEGRPQRSAKDPRFPERAGFVD